MICQIHYSKDISAGHVLLSKLSMPTRKLLARKLKDSRVYCFENFNNKLNVCKQICVAREKTKITKGRKAGRASKTIPAPPPPP